MNTFGAALKANPKRPLSSRVISDYKSSLKHGLTILESNPDQFFKIENPKKLYQILMELEARPKFKKLPSRANIRTAFRAYIESVEILANLKTIAKTHLKDLESSYDILKEKSPTKKTVIKSLVPKISRIFEANQSVKSLGAPIRSYLKIDNQKEIDLIYNVSQNLLRGKYYDMVFKQFEVTAKVIAINSHIKILKAELVIIDQL